jgi:DNA modification methylase
MEATKLATTDLERRKLLQKFKHLIEIDPKLDRTLVSFQANKQESLYRWFKYKEGFSKRLVKFYLNKYHPQPGHVLDPFAGAGATLFAAKELGWDSTGIELLPVGIFAIEARLVSAKVDVEEFAATTTEFWMSFDKNKTPSEQLNHIPITKGAYPEENERLLNLYLEHCNKITNKEIRTLFRFAAFAILEDISYTRKDGQYLRWDHKAKRSWGKIAFDKGKIYSFQEAIEKKLNQIKQDLNPVVNLDLFSSANTNGHRDSFLKIIQGSSLETLPRLNSDSFDFIITSPPYCNRYDYTRTYALELVFLQHDNEAVRNLRQAMLSCTVENREKYDAMEAIYKSSGRCSAFDEVVSNYNSCGAMQEVNYVLEQLNKSNLLNNSNIPRMVKNYFFEMAFIIFEMQRVLKTGGFVVMVNDNVRYGGEEVPVDLILSHFAEAFGLSVVKIWTLPVGKGNSSQQMGNHGRTELRKCIYVWSKD